MKAQPSNRKKRDWRPTVPQPEPRTKEQLEAYLKRFGKIPETYAEQYAADECMEHSGPPVRTD